MSGISTHILDLSTGLPAASVSVQLEVASDRNLDDPRLPVQWVVRAKDYRGSAGRLASGVLRPGDEVLVLPQGERTTIAGIDTFDGPLAEAVPPESVTVDAPAATDGGQVVKT